MISPINHAAIHLIADSRHCQASARKLNTGNADQRYHRFMSETPPTGHPSAPGPVGFPPGPPPAGPWGPPGPIALNKPARWPMFVMFLITLVAVAAAVAAWLRPIPHNTSPPRPRRHRRIASNRWPMRRRRFALHTRKCKARAVLTQTRNGGDDPNLQLLVAVNMRQVFDAGSAYLLKILAEQPAAPENLAAAAKSLADSYEIITLDGLAGDLNDPAHNAANEAGFTYPRPVQMMLAGGGPSGEWSTLIVGHQWPSDMTIAGLNAWVQNRGQIAEAHHNIADLLNAAKTGPLAMQEGKTADHIVQLFDDGEQLARDVARKNRVKKDSYSSALSSVHNLRENLSGIADRYNQEIKQILQSKEPVAVKMPHILEAIGRGQQEANLAAASCGGDIGDAGQRILDQEAAGPVIPPIRQCQRR